jgi:hypothetical protein
LVIEKSELLKPHQIRIKGKENQKKDGQGKDGGTLKTNNWGTIWTRQAWVRAGQDHGQVA